MEAAVFGKRWRNTALFFLLTAALAGTVLRYYHFRPLPYITYKYLLHAHSHVALLGWLFLACAGLMVRLFLPRHGREFDRLLVVVLIAVLGMMVSFPVQGYATVSITFSTLFLLVSYRFAWRFHRLLRQEKEAGTAVGWLRWALAMLVFSSLGPWALGPIMVTGGSHGLLYNLAVFFYLHFLYNGFFVLAVFALAQRFLDQRRITYRAGRAMWFFRLTAWSVLPAYALSTLWAHPPGWVYGVAAIAALPQAAGLYYGREVLYRLYEAMPGRFFRVLLAAALLAYGLKVALQVPAAWPAIADFVYETRVFTAIGYVHLVMLGVLSVLVLTYYRLAGLLPDSAWLRGGLVLFLAGFVVSEGLLFGQGLAVYYGRGLAAYHTWMLTASWAMFAGLLMAAGAVYLKRQNPVSASET